MDILLSLPIASYFFSTSLTSWSTSLNLIFFYMTWTTLVLSHSPLKIELIGLAAVRLVFWLIPSLLFLLFDTLLPSLSETIKYNGSSALPPRDAKSLSKLLGQAILNLSLESALQASVSLSLAHLLQEPAFRTSTTLPLPFQIIKHIAVLFAAREFLTYYIHRYLLHSQHASNPTKRLTTLHTSHAHPRPSPPFSLFLTSDHPLPFLLHRFSPLYLPALLLRVHLLTFLLFALLATLEETLALSGYTVVPGIIMGGIARRSAAHYRSRGKGNFGCWGVLDWIHGTSLGGDDVVADVKGEAEKHRLRERGGRKAGEAGGMVAEGIEGLRRSGRMRKSRARG